MTDLISKLGYADSSPYRNNPYLDINTPEGYITMENTSIPLMGIDNFGNTRVMKPGKKYKFPGKRVREIPLSQLGGHLNDPKRGDIQSLPGVLHPSGLDPYLQSHERIELGTPLKKRPDFESSWNWLSTQGAGGERRMNAYGQLGDLYRYFAGMPLKHDALAISKYRPKNSKDPNASYVSINDSTFENEVLDNYDRVFNKGLLKNDVEHQEERINDDSYRVSGYTRGEPKHMPKNGSMMDAIIQKGNEHVSNAIGRYILSRGKDDKGNYVSYYDVFDTGSGKPGEWNIGEAVGATKPFEIYGRIYVDPKTGKKMQVKQDGGLTPEQFRPAYMQYSDSLEANIHPNALKTGPNTFYQLTPQDKAKLEKQYKDRASQSTSLFVQLASAFSNAVSHPGDMKYALSTMGSPHYIPMKQKGGYSNALLKYIMDDSDEQEDDGEKPMISSDDVEEVQDNSGDYENGLAMDVASEGYGTNLPVGNPYSRDYIPSHMTGNMAVAPIDQDHSISNPSKYAFNFFKDKGLSPQVAAGIVGNLMQESGNFRQDVIIGERTGDSGLGFGIAQWHPDRKAGLLSWAKNSNKNPYTLDSQLEYVYQEANQRGDLKKVAGAKTSKEAAYQFAQSYERPKIIDPNRINYANNLYPYKEGGTVLKYKIWE